MKRLKYQEQECELTLKEGLEEYLDHIGPDAKLTGDEKVVSAVVVEDNIVE